MIVCTFSGSKGGTGKTTLAVSLSIAAAQVVPSLLVDASSEGGATSYLLGDTPGPYLSENPFKSLRELDAGEGLKLTLAVNRGPLVNARKVSDFLRTVSSRFKFIIVDLPALTDIDAVDRYLPLLEASDVVLAVAEPSPASINSVLYTFGPKKVVIALNCPRPYPKTVIDHYAQVVASFCKRTGYRFVVVPYDPALSRLTPHTLKVVNYTSDEFDAAIARLAELIFS